ncbi:MAG: DNA-binding transcriptional regulator [Bacteroidales bacterium]|nr:DNA-binding transcriptional regulator [Bacteroidales bacterium]
MHKIILLFDISEEYGKNLLKGITRYSKEHGPWVFCRMPLHYRETLGMDRVLEFAKEWEANGIIAQLYNSSDIRKILDAGIPIIAEDFKERFSDIPNITGGYFETGRMGAEYFLNKGFKNFAFYGFRNIVWSRERAEGFEEFVTEHGYTVHSYEHEETPSRELWHYMPSALSQWLKSIPKPIAIMACDDERGNHITEACKHAGIQIPEEIAVLGVDNDELTCNLSDPPLSSINLDIEHGGYETARLMDLLILNKQTGRYDIIVKPTHVITRQSTDICATTDKYIAAALKYIHLNIDNNINVKDVLKKVPLSRRALEIRFFEVTGSAVYKYICNLRIQKFTNKLLETDKSIAEIAIESGFSESKNLSRLFKQIKGTTPLKYRRKFIANKE